MGREKDGQIFHYVIYWLGGNKLADGWEPGWMARWMDAWFLGG